jgi:hypothetical protein
VIEKTHDSASPIGQLDVDEDDDNFDYLDVNTDLSNAIADD